MWRAPIDPARTGDVLWPTVPDGAQRLDAGDAVDCWVVDLAGLPAGALECAARLLSGPERSRAARLLREPDRVAFSGRHLALRLLLARYLDADPATIAIEIEGAGRPVLADQSSRLRFNLTRSGSIALIAVSRTAPVGIDVEAVVPLADAALVASHHFSKEEREAGDLGPSAFLTTWTRKEAVTKALGLGISGFEGVSTGRPDLPPVVDLPNDRAANWSLTDLAPAVGYIGAVAIRRAGCRLNSRFAPWPWLLDQRVLDGAL